jgi:succinate-semialdehyde dehydrogenase/glutarate-semialdehyde dehydrogenase
VAIDDSASRTTKPVIEVFTGKQLTTIPVGITDDVVDAVTTLAESGVNQQAW